jgi:hypothetical protein
MAETTQKLKEWEQIIDEADEDTRPFSPEYIILHCSTEGCDSYQLNDVFSKVDTLNCNRVHSTGIVDGEIMYACDKHNHK